MPKPSSRNLRRSAFLASWIAAYGLAGCSDPPPGVPASDFYLGGIQVNEPDLDDWIDALAREGMNAVEVTDYARQGDWDTDNLWWDDGTGIVPEIRAAKQRGMKVVLVLRVALDHAFERNRFLWHGMIRPKTDAQLNRWFELYGEFAARWAEIAESEGVDVLMIASEMNALTSTARMEEVPSLEDYFMSEEKQEERREELLRHEGVIEDRHLWIRDREHYQDLGEYLEARLSTEASWAAEVTLSGDPEEAVRKINARRAWLEEKWRRLISELRGIYHGRLGYAANFDQYHEVTFWDALDLMGINAYFPLRHELVETKDAEELYPVLKAGWSAVLGDIRDFRRGQGLHGRSLLFTELGYTARRNSTLEPWADTGFSIVKTPAGEERLLVWQDQEPDFKERALAVRALYEAHRELAEPMLGGILYWKLSTVESHKEIEAFLLSIGGPSEDPLAEELRRFLESGE